MPMRPDWPDRAVQGIWFAACLLATNVHGFQNQAELDRFAQAARLQIGVADNFRPSGGFQGRLLLSNESDIALPPGAGNWSIYLHSIRKLDAQTVDGLHLQHLQGDLHRLSPDTDFRGLAPGQRLDMHFTGANWMVSYSDFMPRAFIVAEDLRPVVFANTDTEDARAYVLPIRNRQQQLRQPDDHVPVVDAARRFQDNLVVNAAAVDLDALPLRIFPTPYAVTYGKGRISLDTHWVISDTLPGSFEAVYLQQQLEQQAGLRLARNAASTQADARVIRLQTDAGLPAEAYRLEIAESGIGITGGDRAGVFYGVQSLLGLLPIDAAASGVLLPRLIADDQPRYPWRGMHYDLARNFHGMDVVQRLIEQMGRYKLNRLHLHLTDDEGWRIEIPGLPELTEIGAKRCFDPDEDTCLMTQLGSGPAATGSGSGYFRAGDYIALLRSAAQRHIQVIPEIDMPGHSRAAIKAMQARHNRLLQAGNAEAATQYLLSDPADGSRYLSVQNYDDNAVNVCMASSYRFIAKVVDALAAMHAEAGVPLEVLHIGGDEVGKGAWTDSPACRELTQRLGVIDFKAYFMQQVAAQLGARGIALAGWEDGLMHDATTPFARSSLANAEVVANVWDNIWEWGVADRAYRLANADYQVVLSHATHLYFDHPAEANPDVRGYYWATRYASPAKVFGYMPDNLYANADTTRMGDPITDLQGVVGRPLPALEKPQNILGMQGQVWSETIRSAEQLERMVYPRLLLLAERAWHKAGWEGDDPDTALRDQEWAELARLLALREIPRLQNSGVLPELPKPGVYIRDGLVHANSAFPGLLLSVSSDAGQSWMPYTGPVPQSDAPICFRTHTAGHEYDALQCLP